MVNTDLHRVIVICVELMFSLAVPDIGIEVDCECAGMGLYL